MKGLVKFARHLITIIASMKKVFLLFIVVTLSQQCVQAQHNRFNSELDKFCKSVIKEFRAIPAGRKATLNDMAKQLAVKKYVVFTCLTNSRRTLMLQVWAQTSFYYYGLIGKNAFSIGDTVTSIYPGVGDVLSESGFYCASQVAGEPSRYVICINKEYPENILSSKKEVGTIDTTKGLVVNICFENEKMSTVASMTQIHLPYQSPTAFEKTPQEKQKYAALNHQIALEMLYLGAKTKELIELENAEKY